MAQSPLVHEIPFFPHPDKNGENLHASQGFETGVSKKDKKDWGINFLAPENNWAYYRKWV